jgi:hypothetical protein
MMRPVFVCFFFSMCMALPAQKTMKKSELSTDYLLMDVNSNGGKMFAVKYQGACIAYGKKTKEFYLYGDANGTDIIYLEKIAKNPLRFNPDHFISCSFKDNKVYLSSQVAGKATVITGVFNWQEEHLVWEKEEIYDLSEMQIARAKDLLKNGSPLAALVTYDSVQFSDTYFDAKQVGIELLLGSKKVIDANASKRKFKESAELIEKILNFKGWKWFTEIKNEADLKTALGKGLFGLTYPDFQGYIEAYTRNLLEAKSYDKTIEKGNLYWKYFTNSADLLLNSADAWYAKKDKTKASELYVKYTSLMKQLKKEKEIPYTVPQRIIKE